MEHVVMMFWGLWLFLALFLSLPVNAYRVLCRGCRIVKLFFIVAMSRSGTEM